MDTTKEQSTPGSSRKKSSDPAKRRLLTGYIIYASETRKEVVEKYPNEDFGVISKMVGDMWRELPKEAKVKFDQRAKMYNTRMQERQEAINAALASAGPLPSLTPKLSRRELRRLAKEIKKRKSQMNAAAAAGVSEAPTDTPTTTKTSQPPHSETNGNHLNEHRYSQSQKTPSTASSKRNNSNNNTNNNNQIHLAIQTEPLTVVRPPPKKPLKYSKVFFEYLQNFNLQPESVLSN